MLNNSVAVFINEKLNKIVRVNEGVDLGGNRSFFVTVFENGVLNPELSTAWTSDWDAIRHAAGACFSYLKT